MSQTSRPTEGYIVRGGTAGFVGATILALWFLLVDGLAGRPFHTPAFLFRVLFGSEPLQMAGAQVALYSILHYGVFLAVGLAAAWIVSRLRVSVGLLGGVVLGFLLFDLLFYGSVWFTGVDVVGYLGWAEVLAGNVLAGIALFGTLRLMDRDRNVSWGELMAEHTVLREGITVGLVGAVAVAVWFLIIDVVAGRILFTPAALGSIVFTGATGPGDVDTGALVILGYTGLHMGAFFVTGIVAAGLAALAEDRQPYFIFGAILLFVTFETFFIGIIAIAAQWLFEVISWWSIAVSNLIAAAAMGYYLWNAHPDLAAALSEADLEDTRTEDVRSSRRAPDDEDGAPAESSVSPPGGGSIGGGPGRP
ncbi:MAG: hypothetical protein R3314_01195 [Longimicrobiales bacterium]|nr:hypothetical protein [Longimicrobiales bacterium]